MHRKVVSGIMLILLLIGMFTLAFDVQPVEAIVRMDEYYWVDGDNVDIGFSKYGEMISYDETTGVGVGLQYPGYETVGTHDQTDGTSRDPFTPEGIRVKYWLNGWLLEARYTHRILGDRRILAFALFADMRSYGGDWIVGKKLPFPTFPYGGRKTTAYAETDDTDVLYDDPERFKALCTTHIFDWEDSDEDEVVDHPTETWPVLDVMITIIFNKAKKEVIVLKDAKLVISSEILDSPVDCQLSNRGEWDLGPDPIYESYVHFYHDPSADIAQVISRDLDYVGWAAFCPHLSDYTVDGWAHVFNPLLNVTQPDMTPGYEPDIPFIIGEWDFTLDSIDPFPVQFSGVTIYGISDLTDGDDHDIGPDHENVVDSAVVIEVPAPPDLTVFDPEIDGLHVWINGVVFPGTEGASITRIHWDWGDGWEEDHWFPASHTYSSGGDYTITVTAYQSDGLNSTETKSVSLHAYIYIRADGSVEPDSAPISSVDNVTYTFFDNIYGEIVVERDNIVVDGAGYTLQGTGAYDSEGISLYGKGNVTIRSMEIKNFWTGILLSSSSNNYISENTITNNHFGMLLSEWSSSNSIFGNTITNNEGCGISLSYSGNNDISGYSIIYNRYGINLYYSTINIIYHNNFLDNTEQVDGTYRSSCVWDDGYPSGGNYWSDHVTVDDCCGIDQDEPGSDGIVDEPYIIDEWPTYNRDNYPLVEPWSPLPRTIGELKTEIEELGSEGQIDNQGIVKSLLAKLNVTQKLVDKGKIDEARSILEEDFIPQVQNISNIHITPEAADILIQSAEYILSDL